LLPRLAAAICVHVEPLPQNWYEQAMGSKFGCLANQFIVLQDHKRLPARFFARVHGALNSRFS